MIALPLVILFSILFGYFLVSLAKPIRLNPLQWAVLTTFLPFLYGFGILMALVVAAIVDPKQPANPGGLVLAIVLCAVPAFGVGLGAYLHAKRHPEIPPPKWK